MKLLKLKSPILLGLGIMLFVLSACGGGSGSASSSQTPAQLLLKTANTMKQLKSVAFDLDMSNAMNMSGLTQPITIAMKGTGAQVKPDLSQTQLSISVGSLVQKLTMTEIVAGQKLYVQNQKKQWYVLDKSVLSSTAGASSNPFSGVDVDNYAKLLTLANDTAVKDHGTVTLSGASLRHLTLTFSKNALSDLLSATGALNSLGASQQQTLNKLLQGMTMKNTVLDVWIDEATSYLHRMQLQLDIVIDGSKFVTPTTGSAAATSTISDQENVTIDYSKFNQPATITVPTDATPTQSILSAFS